MRAFIVGYTGECAKALIRALAKDPRYTHVKLVGRRDVDVDFGTDVKEEINKFDKHIVDFDDLSKSLEAFSETDVGFCGLGTTIRASGREGQRKVDLEYVMNVGEIALNSGCKEYHVISSMGANAQSLVFYSRLKGEMEAELTAKLKFPKALSFFRPGLLLCNRETPRVGERIFTTFMKPVNYFAPAKYSTSTEMLALALANAPVHLAKVVSPILSAKNESPAESVNGNVYIVETNNILQLSKCDG